MFLSWQKRHVTQSLLSPTWSIFLKSWSSASQGATAICHLWNASTFILLGNNLYGPTTLHHVSNAGICQSKGGNSILELMFVLCLLVSLPLDCMVSVYLFLILMSPLDFSFIVPDIQLELRLIFSLYCSSTSFDLFGQSFFDSSLNIVPYLCLFILWVQLIFILTIIYTTSSLIC
jgi:hypothetical protein